jgi:RNA polymerase sigma factor (sigma-70 family)
VKQLANKIYRQYGQQLRQFIRQKVNNEQDVAEILQETMVAAWESRAQFRQQSAFFTWLCGIAKHEIADFYRKKKIKSLLFSRFPWLESLASQALGPEQALLKRELSAKVWRAMGRLSEGYQQVLRLKYYHGLTVVEIAAKLNETVKAVESRLFRARKAFAEVFLADTA